MTQTMPEIVASYEWLETRLRYWLVISEILVRLYYPYFCGNTIIMTGILYVLKELEAIATIN